MKENRHGDRENDPGRTTYAFSDTGGRVGLHRLRMTSSLFGSETPYAGWLKYELVQTSANFTQGLVRDGIALAERTLARVRFRRKSNTFNCPGPMP